MPPPPNAPHGLLKARVGILRKTSLVDFPGRVCAAVFLAGCNLRCPYCYNIPLAVEDRQLPNGTEAATLEEVLLHLEKRRNVLSSLAISGGEPLLNPCTPFLVRHAKRLGYSVKLDTNGTLPRQLKTLCEDPSTRPDIISMDLKTDPRRYGLLGYTSTHGAAKTPAMGHGNATQSLAETIGLMREYPENLREWRTVLVPGLVGSADIEAMAALLPHDARWYLSPFQNGDCLDASYNALEPYTEQKTEELLSLAKSLIPQARTR